MSNNHRDLTSPTLDFGIQKNFVTPAITGFDWVGLILISFVLPAVIAPIINMICKKIGWVKDGDLTLPKEQ